MLIHKITYGFVTQTFDTEQKGFVSQAFTAGDQIDHEDSDGEPVDTELFNRADGQEAQMLFHMEQPVRGL